MRITFVIGEGVRTGTVVGALEHIENFLDMSLTEDEPVDGQMRDIVVQMNQSNVYSVNMMDVHGQSDQETFFWDGDQWMPLREHPLVTSGLLAVAG
jgi:hypothetical protein